MMHMDNCCTLLTAHYTSLIVWSTLRLIAIAYKNVQYCMHNSSQHKTVDIIYSVCFASEVDCATDTLVL